MYRNKPFPTALTSAIAFTGAVLLGQWFAAALYAAPLYKWVEEDGQIRYSDTLPTQQSSKRFQKIAPDGRILITQEAAKSREEIQRERNEQQRLDREMKLKAETEAREAALQEHHDNVLLMTFTNEEEILEAQDERLAVIDSVINLLHKNIESEMEKLETEERIAKQRFTDKGKVIAGGQAQKIEYHTDKVLSKQQHLSLKMDEREKVKQQYVTDLIRYRELKQLQKEKAEAGD
ncbi:MAG: DUF4124 domain-containing protein [Gammaproteobacteria bacterium]|nr:DUF4124 domain-containing protein [Gammaproteobacteria bacterium]MBL7000060.1 DUF4124 domain-containing protein [Gammaproteobacteria bacterium]